MTGTATAVSAPGKVLFAGGFLVLDRKHTGLVFGLNARIHVQVQPWPAQTGETKVINSRQSLVLVCSPQFTDAKWLYQIDVAEPSQDKGPTVVQLTSDESYTQSRNKFVEITLQYVLTYLKHISKDIGQSVQITILADNDYYSQPTTSLARSYQNFTYFGIPLSEVHKTGLGSSAALVTSLTAALVTFFSGDHNFSKQAIHNLAQAAHCAAQGKVGSGFDIAAAVFGSCLYRRFTPGVLERVGEPDTPGFGERLHLCVDDLDFNSKWDVEISDQSVKIPPSLLLLMCDVDCGSETPGMVRKVLQWRKEKPAEAEFLWNAIQQGSNDLCQELRRLSGLEGLNMTDQKELGDIIATIRDMVKEMSRKSGVPIEPDVITELLDYCSALPGVIGGVAPGAGGYDAVALLVRNDAETLQDLADRLDAWTSREESSGATIGKVRLLHVRQADEGMRIEDPERYGHWVSRGGSQHVVE